MTGPAHHRLHSPSVSSLQAEVDRLAALYRAGDCHGVVARGGKLARRHPGVAVLHMLVGAAAAGLKDHARAEAAFARAAALEPRKAEHHNNHATALAALGRLDAAIAGFGRAIALDAHYADPHFNLGNALRRRGDTVTAIDAYERALALRPDHADAANNLGMARQDAGDIDRAIAGYRHAAALRPDHAEAHYNLGNALGACRAMDDAIAAYRRAIAIRPDHAETWNNLGTALQQQGDGDGAFQCYGRALAIQPQSPDTLHNLGNLLLEKRELKGAIDAFGLALALAPDKAEARAQWFYARAHVCDFSVHDEAAAAIGTPRLAPGAVPPFTMLAFADDPAIQLAYARGWRAAAFDPAAPAPRPEPGSRIRVGYFSADFHDHATLWLMTGLLRHHDRTRFEITAYSYGPPRDDALRAELLANVDRFVDIRDLGNREVVALAREHGLDIAVDLKGYTEHSRTALFAGRMAPVQIAYLGFPGSIGADFIDYLVADRIVIPPAEEAHYAERIIHLPVSYQPNDNTRAIAAPARRADFGLPADAFVFCCFNHTYKIGPREWDVWMRLLAAVPGSVLWLLRSNEHAEANLRAEAAARGIDPARLVFADNLPQDRHLARMALADLFLDTFAVNAHTTASDALWAGLPLLTRAGRQYAARVAASLLTAIGLPDLITVTDAEYEALALALATDPARLAGLRARLAANRDTHPLFDSEGYARNLEAAFAAVHRRAGEGG